MHGVEAADGDFWSVKWNPPDWRFGALPMPGSGRLDSRYRALVRLATSGTPANWRRTFAAHEPAMIAVARELAKREKNRVSAFARLRTAPHFVVFVYDGSEKGPALARASIHKRRFEALFAKELGREKERAALATVPVDERARYLVTRFGVFDGAVTSERATRALVAMGANAVPALIDALSNKEHGWHAAMTLAEIGSAAHSAAAALLRYASAADSSPRALWCARALGRLGKLEVLVDLAESIEALLSDKSDSVRQAAEAALAHVDRR